MRNALNGDIAGPKSRRSEDPAGNREGKIAKRLVQHHATIFRPRLRQHRIVSGLGPVERSAVDDRPAHRIAVPADEFGQRVDDNVGAMFDRPNQIGAGQRVVDDQRQAMLAGNVADLLDIDELPAWVRQAFNEDAACLGVDLAFEARLFHRCRPTAPPSRNS